MGVRRRPYDEHGATRTWDSPQRSATPRERSFAMRSGVTLGADC
ncbi:hypothetical protein [Archaeoglobus sp.]